MGCGQDSCTCVANPGRCQCLCGACSPKKYFMPCGRLAMGSYPIEWFSNGVLDVPEEVAVEIIWAGRG
jgi:hypothetical protein